MLNRIKHLRAGCLAALLLLVALPAAAATIEVTPDRNPVPPGESFRLVFSAHGSVDDDPDFTPLQKDFDILSQGRSSQVNIVNGSFSRVTQWTLELMPKQAGELTVPAIHFGTDVSPEIKVSVGGGTATAVPGNRDLFLELEVGPRNPYVQAQVLYTVRLLRTVELEPGEPQ